MPTIKSSKKRLRQRKKRQATNKKRKQQLKSVVKKIENLLDQGEHEQARDLIPELMRKADQAVAKGPLHKNKASRIKSKLMKRIEEQSE